jgi:hypothetical protein
LLEPENNPHPKRALLLLLLLSLLLLLLEFNDME